jgi:putative ABC transport system permease protein
VSVRRAPLALGRELARIPGVAELELRIVGEVVLDVPGSAEIVTGRLVSVPDRPRPMLNGLHLVRGRYPAAGAEVAVSAAFAAANRLDLGDTLGALVNGRRERLRVSAITRSPEYIYEIPSGINILPDARRFGVIWAPRRLLAAAFGLDGAFNHAVIALQRGASVGEVIAAVDRLTAPYGGLGAYDREDQVSHEFVSSEIEETQVTSILIPTIFLGVTAFMLYLVTSRLVATEREQIAVLKAFGFSNARVLAHYVQFILAPAAAGTVGGAVLGLGFAGMLADVYARFFQVPSAEFQPDPGIILVTMAIGGVAAVAGGVASVRAVLQLSPASAMQPPAPPRFRAGMLERIGLARRVAAPARIIVRNLERRPVKAGLTVLGIALGYSIIVAGWYGFDAMDLIETTAFYEADRSDLSVGFGEITTGRVRRSLERLPGVTRVETFRAAPARLRSSHREVRTALLGLPGQSELRRVVAPPATVIPIPGDGVLLTSALAQRLAAGRGSAVEVEILDGSRRRFRLNVAAVVDELVGLAAYLDRDRLHRLLGERDVASRAWLTVERAARERLARERKDRPLVAGVGDRAATLAAFDRTIAESFRISLVTVFGVACLIAVAVVYNSGRIALSERARELASLRVLGFTQGEVTTMLLGEQAILTVLALPVGAAIGYGLCYLMTVRFASELFPLPLVLDPRAYVMAAGVVVVAALATGLLIRRRVYRLDLVQVLKARE